MGIISTIIPIPIQRLLFTVICAKLNLSLFSIDVLHIPLLLIPNTTAIPLCISTFYHLCGSLSYTGAIYNSSPHKSKAIPSSLTFILSLIPFFVNPFFYSFFMLFLCFLIFLKIKNEGAVTTSVLLLHHGR